MGKFGPGILLDPVTMRPVAGRVLQVLDVDSDLPLTTDPAVVSTNSRGYYGQFEVADKHAVLIRGGGVDEVIAAVDTTAGALTTASPGVILDQAVSADTEGQGIWSALAPNGVIDRPNAAPNPFLNRLTVTALTLPAMSIEALSINIQTAGAAGAILRFGIYTAAANGSLGTLIYDSGNIDATTTGYKTVTPTTPVSIPSGGVYWLGVVASDSAVRFGGWEHHFMARLGGPSVAFKYTTTASGSWTPGSPLPTTSVVFRTNSSSPAPLLWAKVVLH